MKIILAILFLVASAQAQLIAMGKPQVVASGNTWTTSSGWSAAGTTSTTRNCSNVCAAVTVPATVAGDLLYVEAYTSASNAVFSAGSAGGSWVFSANCNAFQAGAGGLTCGYVLSATGAVTSIQMTMNNPDSSVFLHFRSYHPSIRTAVAETVPAGVTSAGCGATATKCNAPNITLTSADTPKSELIVSGIVTGDTACNTALGSYGNFASPTGDGFVDQVAATVGTGMAWTQGTSCPTGVNAAAATTSVAFK